MKRPLLIAAALFGAGVLLGEAWPWAPFALLAIAVAGGLACLACGWLGGVTGALSTHRANIFSQPAGLSALMGARLRPAFLIALLVFSGWASHSLHTAVLSQADLRRLIQNESEIVTIRGRLLDTPAWKMRPRQTGAAGRMLLRVDSESIVRDGQWYPAAGRVMVVTTSQLGPAFYAGRKVEVDGVIARPQVARAPGLFDNRQHLERRGMHFELRTDKLTRWRLLDTNSPPRRPLVDHFRQWSIHNLARGLPERDGALELLWAMSLGWRTALTGEVKEPFMRSGTMHLFAISGLHIGMVAAILIVLLRVLRVPRIRVGLVAIPLLWFYTAATGWQPSAVRATVMMSVILAGWSLKRPVDLLNSIGAAAFIILLWDPRQLFMASFQLSFTVVFGLALVLPPLVDRLRPWVSPDPMLPRALWPWWRRWAMTAAYWFINSASVSLTAWLTSAPLIAWHFHLFTPAALVANVPVVACGMLALISCLGSLLCGGFLVPFALIADLFTLAAELSVLVAKLSVLVAKLFASVDVLFALFASLFVLLATLFTLIAKLVAPIAVLFESVTVLFNHSAWFFMKCMMGISEWATTLPGAYHYVRAPGAFFFVAYYLVLFGLGTGWLLRRNVRWWAIGGLTAVAVVGVTQWQTDRRTVRLNLLPGTPAVYQEDFKGQPGLLVDTGDARGIEFNVIPILRTRGVDSLDTVALTHGTKHQVGGFTNLVSVLPPRLVHRSHAKTYSGYSKAIDELLAKQPRLARTVSAGDRIGPWEVLHPPLEEDHRRSIDDALVLRGAFHGVRVILISDLGEAGQESLVRRVKNLQADMVVASVPNFGELLQPWLLEAIKPRVILVHDSHFPLGERASALLKARLARGKAQVIYTTAAGGLRVEIAPGGWRVLNASGVLWESR